MRTLRFGMGNLLAAYLVLQLAPGQIHLHLPVRLQPTLPVFLTALFFTMLARLSQSWWPDRLAGRTLPPLLLAPLAVALAGSFAAALHPLFSALTGARLALTALWQSPWLSAPALVWAVGWSLFNYPPPPEQPPEARPQPADWELLAGPPGEWVGGDR